MVWVFRRCRIENRDVAFMHTIAFGEDATGHMCATCRLICILKTDPQHRYNTVIHGTVQKLIYSFHTNFPAPVMIALHQPSAVLTLHQGCPQRNKNLPFLTSHLVSYSALRGLICHQTGKIFCHLGEMIPRA